MRLSGKVSVFPVHISDRSSFLLGTFPTLTQEALTPKVLQMCRDAARAPAHVITTLGALLTPHPSLPRSDAAMMSPSCSAPDRRRAGSEGTNAGRFSGVNEFILSRGPGQKTTERDGRTEEKPEE